ncbi:hypothetical protein HMSSN036_69710 [Paenibacillus macerans]|nr:hypothetical protein HMSSN036_69710 [Paenibacillus macerans]
MLNGERLIRRDYVELKPEEKVSALLAELRQGKMVVTAAGDEGVCLFAPRDASLLEEVTGRIGEYLAAHGAAFAAVVVHEVELSVSGPLHELIVKLSEAGGRTAIVVVDKKGRPIGYCLFGEMLRAVGETGRQTEAYFRTLLETVSDAVTVVDRNGTVVGWNAVAEEVYGIAKEDIVGRTIGEHFDPETLVVLKILDEGRRLQGAYHRPRPDTHVLINASPIVAEGDGEIIGGVATEQDITHLVKLNDELGAAQSRLLTHKMGDRDPFALLHARGESMGKVVKIAKKIAETDSPVLFIGETGAGKEQLAKVIHRASRRSEGPFLSVNCGAIPVGLAEAELFGYQGGAFPAGRPVRPASWRRPTGGAVLNEIDRLSPDVQDKLCRFMKTAQLRGSAAARRRPYPRGFRGHGAGSGAAGAGREISDGLVLRLERCFAKGAAAQGTQGGSVHFDPDVFAHLFAAISKAGAGGGPGSDACLFELRLAGQSDRAAGGDGALRYFERKRPDYA